MEYSINEAARHLGISVSTLRRRLRARLRGDVVNGVVGGRQVETPQGFVWMVELDGSEASEGRFSDASETSDTYRLIASLEQQILDVKQDKDVLNKTVDGLMTASSEERRLRVLTDSEPVKRFGFFGKRMLPAPGG